MVVVTAICAGLVVCPDCREAVVAGGGAELPSKPHHFPDSSVRPRAHLSKVSETSVDARPQGNPVSLKLVRYKGW